MKKELRLYPLRVMLTATEFEQIRLYAARERLSISTAVRRIVLLAAEQRASVDFEKATQPEQLEA